MKGMRFYILDVFAEEKYAGNQLAVVRDAGVLSDAEMQKIAKEMNYSETTFILSDTENDGGYDVRIFTPAAEVPFAGHPTLGTAFVIQKEIIGRPVDTVHLNLGVGQIPVVFGHEKDGGLLWMKQKAPTFGPTIDAGAIAEILNLGGAEIDDRFAAQEVSTGMWFLIVPLTSLDAVKRARVAKSKYFAFVKDRQAKGTLVFCCETYSRENDLNVRMFAPCYGIEEDPATGSANGCLAGYLVKHRYFGSDRIDIRVEQGHEVGRPSLLYLRASDADGRIDVSVGGKVVMVAEGQLL